MGVGYWILFAGQNHAHVMPIIDVPAISLHVVVGGSMVFAKGQENLVNCEEMSPNWYD